MSDISYSPKSARALNIAVCHHCHQLVRGHGRCSRCNTLVHFRKPDSLTRTWAFLIAAIAFFIPANLVPIMNIKMLGQGEPATIMEGVILFIEHGDLPIAIVIFVASVLVPLLKIVALVFLLLSVHFEWARTARRKTILYRIVEFIGRWSMIDIFVVTVLVALVQLDKLASIEVSEGATAFCFVVVLTMVSALCFDTRLIWDIKEESTKGNKR
ncbi:paraquat-inducible protein A [Pleionea sp. CnH1-48]|uniref:paraquat-inducible protein A n=1 Tax=Pleionea sp. CnH1-48 TaxID=2954494 RepID=UPI0020968DAF|nr:paraquat-inducible protein A [Pleionea sp. CnH1-48]MCO7223476.1 paraquat-inducible protein A [Pleionea sp. CnH1-48]